MILCVGSWPSRNAGKATEAMIDFKDRGGRLTSRDELRVLRLAVNRLAEKGQAKLRRLEPNHVRDAP